MPDRSISPAVLLLNLGSPDAPDEASVRAYLKEFLLDPRVIDSPSLVRNAVVRGLILPSRPKKSAEAYRSIWTDAGSPLVLTSERQQRSLAEATGLPVELAMRYGKPDVDCAVHALKHQGATHVFVMPMYPQYAMSSYETAIVDAMRAFKELAPDIQTTLLQPFYQEPAYIEALVASAEPYLARDYDQLLFSFHGIPERHLRKTDPSHDHCLSQGCCDRPHPCHATCYRHQCLATVKAFVKRAKLMPGSTCVSFQSRLGRDPWLQPYTDHRLEALPAEGCKRLLVICPAFVTDCLETLEEIQEEGREIFLKAGGTEFEQIPCLNDQPHWIEVLAKWVSRWSETLPDTP
jgi:ferrochelatase